jgi:hypothetical protein
MYMYMEANTSVPITLVVAMVVPRQAPPHYLSRRRNEEKEGTLRVWGSGLGHKHNKSEDIGVWGEEKDE